jgi:hypothetical protein
MNLSRLALCALGVSALGLAACSGKTPTDAQLTQLLRAERSAPSDPKAPLDIAAINCLRAWSGDIELSAALPPAANGDAFKQACKARLDGWLADATRNPDKLAFDKVSKPPSVKRAMALMTEHQMGNAAAAHTPSADERPPALLTRGPNAAQATAQEGPADMTEAIAAVDQLDGLCQKAKAQAATGDPAQPLARYAGFCDKRIEQMRTRIAMLQQHGSPQQAQNMTNNAQRMLTMAKQIEAQPNQPPALAAPAAAPTKH